MRRNHCIAVGMFILVCALEVCPQAAGADPVELGVIAGEPTGLSAKLWTGGRSAYDVAAAWSLADDTALHLHADYLVHFFDRLDVDQPGRLPFHVGVGARIKFRDVGDDLVGIRISLGLDYLLAHEPISFFVEVAPILDLTPDTEWRANAALGVRYIFR